ncbi:MAG: large rane protein [Acidimicrobiaceae bacterium]|nr:large rane protein [Acidimicrobiaceae bacterium]
MDVRSWSQQGGASHPRSVDRAVLPAASSNPILHEGRPGQAGTGWPERSSGERDSHSPGGQLLVTVRQAGGSYLLADLLAAKVTSVIGSPDATHALIEGFISEARQPETPAATVVHLDGIEIGAPSLPRDFLARHLSRSDGGPILIVLEESMPAFAETASQLMAAANGRCDLAVVVRGSCAEAGLVIVATDPPATNAVFTPARNGVQTRCLEEPTEQRPLEVAVLGPIEIAGVEGPLAHRPKLTELVVYLAMHPRGATSRAWTTALWPERRVPSQTVANRLSEARRALGFAPDERPRLRRSGDRHLLADTTTDWEQFVRLGAPSGSASSWREALALVRGRPFDDLQQGQWTALEGFTAEIEQAIVTCALRYGAHALESDEPMEASWAAQMALRAAPWDERLHRLLMRSADAAGNRAGVEAILRHLALVLEIDGDPLRGVHPKTAALYQQLAGRDPTLLTR